MSLSAAELAEYEEALDRNYAEIEPLDLRALLAAARQALVHHFPEERPPLEQIVLTWAPGSQRWRMARLDSFGEWLWAERGFYGAPFDTVPTHWCELPPLPEAP